MLVAMRPGEFHRHPNTIVLPVSVLEAVMCPSISFFGLLPLDKSPMSPASLDPNLVRNLEHVKSEILFEPSLWGSIGSMPNSGV